MAPPQSYKAVRHSTGDTPTRLDLVTEDAPSLKPNDVLIRIHGVFLNYRDIAMRHCKYPPPVIDANIPASDCATEIVAVVSLVQASFLGGGKLPSYRIRVYVPSHTLDHSVSPSTFCLLQE